MRARVVILAALALGANVALGAMMDEKPELIADFDSLAHPKSKSAPCWGMGGDNKNETGPTYGCYRDGAFEADQASAYAAESRVLSAQRSAAGEFGPIYGGVTLEGDMTYLGCYVDNSRGVRDFDFFAGHSDNMSPDFCRLLCATHGKEFIYIGVQHYDECFCSVTPPGSQGIGEETDCNTPCTSNPEDADEADLIICGGGNRNSVYQLAAPDPHISRIGPGGYVHWHAGQIDVLSDRDQWAGFNNFLRHGTFEESCPDCSPAMVNEPMQSCYPMYDDQYNFLSCDDLTDRPPYYITKFDEYAVLERWYEQRDDGWTRRCDEYDPENNINGNSHWFDNERNGQDWTYIPYREYKVYGNYSFDGTYPNGTTLIPTRGAITVKPMDMAKHCHVTFRYDSIYYVSEIQHNLGRQYDDLNEVSTEECPDCGQRTYDDPAWAIDPATARPTYDRCDCTRNGANGANGCGREECAAMHVRQGVRCNNCGGRCNQCWEWGYCNHKSAFTKADVDANPREVIDKLTQHHMCQLCLEHRIPNNDRDDGYFEHLYHFKHQTDYEPTIPFDPNAQTRTAAAFDPITGYDY